MLGKLPFDSVASDHFLFIMFKPLKITTDGKVFFWSDIHSGHEKILNGRGFVSTKEAKEVLIDRCNKTVSNNDILCLLGDSVVGAGENGQAEFEHLLNTLNYKELYALPGNHPSGFSQVYKEALANGARHDQYLRLKIEKFGRPVYLVPNYFEITLHGRYIILSHYPILSWNKMADYSWNIFGHCHNSLVLSEWVRENYLKGLCLDVGVEAQSFPIEFNEIKELFKNRKKLEIDHHV